MNPETCKTCMGEKCPLHESSACNEDVMERYPNLCHGHKTAGTEGEKEMGVTNARIIRNIHSFLALPSVPQIRNEDVDQLEKWMNEDLDELLATERKAAEDAVWKKVSSILVESTEGKCKITGGKYLNVVFAEGYDRGWNHACRLVLAAKGEGK